MLTVCDDGETGGWGARRFFLPELRIGLSIWLTVSRYSSSNGFVLLTLVCDVLFANGDCLYLDRNTGVTGEFV